MFVIWKRLEYIRPVANNNVFIHPHTFLFLTILSHCLFVAAADIACSAAASTPECQYYEIACSTGAQCIDARRKCDGRADCRDGSDERDCDG